MTNPKYNRLFLTTDDTTPAGVILDFTSPSAVANYYGASSYEASMAQSYFAPGTPAGATMEFTRIPEGQRPHLLGDNLAPLTLAGLQSIHGTLGLSFDGFDYSGDVALASATSYADAAKLLTSALHNLPPVATTINDTLTKVVVNFTGWTNYSEVDVTNPSGSIPVGAIIQDNGVNLPPYDGKGNDEVILTHPPNNGVAKLDLYGPAGDSYDPTPRPMTATYYRLDIGSVTAGSIAPGLRLDDGTPLSAITAQLGPNSWVVNYATDSSGDFKITAPSLIVANQDMSSSNQFFEIQPEGVFDFNHIQANLSYAYGTTAAALGLTQAAGAIDSLTTYQEASYPSMLDAINLLSNHSFGSFQSDNSRPADQFQSWSTVNGPIYLANSFTTTPPAGSQ